MRYLTLLLLCFPLTSVLAKSLDCKQLAKAAAELEKQIQNKRLPPSTCSTENAESLGMEEGAFVSNKEWDYRCKDLSAVDLQLKSLQSEVALINGIQELKIEIDNSAKTIKATKNPTVATSASQSLVANLAIAQSLESFLATNNSKSENILSKIVKKPDAWKDLASFKKVVEAECANFKNIPDSVCSGKFVLTEEVFQELDGFVRNGGNTDRKFNRRQVEELSDALAITKDGQPYSYSQLAQELKVGEDGIVDSAVVAKMKTIPELKNNSKYDFLLGIKGSVEDLDASQDYVHAKATPARFVSFLTDLKKRQEWEMKSQLSLVLHKYNAQIPNEVSSQCESARSLQVSPEECLTALSKNKSLYSFERSGILDIRDEMKHDEAHVKKLDEMIRDCVPGEIFPAKCEGMLSNSMADLQTKILALTKIREKMIVASPELILFRDYALEKLHSNECDNSEDSNISTCYQEVGTISHEAVALSGNAMGIVFLLDKKNGPSTVENLCTSGVERIPFKQFLCDLDDDKDEEESKKKEKSAERKVVFDSDPSMPTLTPPQGKSNNQALWSALMGASSAIGNYMTPYQPIPYQYGPNTQYNFNQNQALDTYQKVMAPQVFYGGYGSYRATTTGSSSTYFRTP